MRVHTSLAQKVWAPFLSKAHIEPSAGQPFTFETAEGVSASISAARIACGNWSRAFAITSVKLPLPSKREMMLKGEGLEEMGGLIERVQNCWISLGQIIDS